MKILGVHIGHDSSAALVVDGKIIADVAEERFSRLKHDSSFPSKAIEYCLNIGEISINDIDVIAVPSNSYIPELNILFDLDRDKQERPSRSKSFFDFGKLILKKPGVKLPVYIKRYPIKKSAEIVHVEHHLSHAASAYYTSGLKEKQLIVTMDGMGNGYSTCLWRGENGKIEPLKKFTTSASLGWFYGNVTEALGWWHGDGEGKTMGLAPYGNSVNTKGVLDKYYPKFCDGNLVKEHDFGRSYTWKQHGSEQYHFDEADAIKELINKYGRENIAAEAQRVLEEQAKEIVFPWLKKENTANLSCAGGIFLNVKLNQRLWESGKIKNHNIFANPGDSGLALGAALYVYFQNFSNQAISSVEDVYWGPEYSNTEIEKVLKLRHLQYKYLENPEEYAARQLADNKIVAWFQGRMESGPRALGNRSILMSANKSENKETINAKVKFREAFRPFCPSLIWEKKEEYLDKPRDEFFMITSFTCKEEKRNSVPAVVHADNTLRPQTVKREFNKKYWNLINEFGKLTGEYMILNTSFNVMGEPIVNHPREAIKCFFDNGLDCLIMGNYLLTK